MPTQRTFTNKLKTIYRWSIAAIGVFGYMQVPNIPFIFSTENSNTTFSIVTNGNFGSPIEMAENVTIPLENALGGLPVKTKITSETTASESSISVALDEQPTQAIYQYLMQLIRETAKRLPAETEFPRLEHNMTTAKGLEVLVWLKMSENTVRMHLPELLDSLRRVPGTNNIKVALHNHEQGSSVSRVRGNSTINFALQQTEQASADAQQWLFFRNHIIAKENLSIRNYGIRIPDEPVTINGFEGVRLVIVPDAGINTLWWRWNILRRFNQLTDIPFFQFFVISDPYDWVVTGLTSQFVAIAGLLILLCFFRKFHPSALFKPFIFPGLYIYFFWLGEKQYDPTAIEILGFLWLISIIIHFIPKFNIGSHTIYYLLGAAVLCSFLASQSVFSTNLHDFVSLVPGIFALCLILIDRILRVPIISFGKYHLPFLAIGIIVMVIAIQITDHTRHTSIGLFKKTTNGSTKLPGDNLLRSRHLILRAHKTRFAPDPGPESGKMLMKLLDDYQPDILVHETDGSKQKTFQAFWKKLSEKQSLQLRSAIIPLLLYQNGTRWTLNGLGESFQNDRVFIPGTYQIDFSGPDYDELLTKVTQTADSVSSLPGTGSVGVNEDPYSFSPYYSLSVNPAFQDNPHDISQYLHLVGDPQDTMSLMHNNYFTAHQTNSLAGKASLQLTESPAPVRRTNNRFIISLSYAHYAGEKYALEFYYKLHAKLRGHLKSGMAILPITYTTTPAKTFNGLILFVIGMVAILGSKSAITTLFFIDLLTIWVITTILFCYFHDYSIAAFMLKRIMLLTICLLLLVDMKKEWIMGCLGIMSLYQIYGYLFFEIGKLRVESELTLCLTAAGGLYCLIATNKMANHQKGQLSSTTV